MGPGVPGPLDLSLRFMISERKFYADHFPDGGSRQPELVSDGFKTRVARFFLLHDTKTGEIYQMNTNVPNGHKISQMSVKYSKWP
jgi:hypothetical protein